MMYGLGAGVWTQDGTGAYRFSPNIPAGRARVNNCRTFPFHAAFEGSKQSGIGRETHKMMLDYRKQTKIVLSAIIQLDLASFNPC